MADDKKRKGLWETIQTFGAGAGIAALGKIAFEEILTSAGKKTIEAVGERVSSSIGLSSKDAAKSDKDEIITRKALIFGKFSKSQQDEFWEWLARLRDSNPKLANETTKTICNIFTELAKKTTKKGKNKDGEEKVSENYLEATLVAKDLIERILNAPDDDARLVVLKRANIIIKPQNFVDKAADFIVKEVKTRGGEIIDGQKTNHQNLLSQSERFKQNAQRRWNRR